MVDVVLYLVNQIVIILQALHVLQIGQVLEVSLMMYVDIGVVIVDHYDSTTHRRILLHLWWMLINSILVHIHKILLRLNKAFQLVAWTTL